MNQDKPLTYLLGQTVNLVKLKMTEKFRDNNIELSMENFILLNFINKNKNLTQQDLANHFMRDKSIILRNVNTLIELHYIKRVTDKSDKRKKNLILTEKANTFLSFALKLSHEVSEELLKGISGEELIHFENVINKIQLNTGYSKCLSNNNHV
jgi:MarR family transcriptional regulator, transcriptional regulator for hemolysin